MSPDVVAWDFDGVLNRNIRDGRFVWADRFEEDTGRSLSTFQRHVFTDWAPVLTGREPLRDRVARWAEAEAYAPGPDALIDYWFGRDMHPDPEMLALVEGLAARGVRQVMATNNEPTRAALIERDTPFAPHIERVFASGRLGVAKPDPAFLEAITTALALPPEAMLLVDDHAPNLAAARALGWRAFHLTDDTRAALPAALPR